MDLAQDWSINSANSTKPNSFIQSQTMNGFNKVHTRQPHSNNNWYNNNKLPGDRSKIFFIYGSFSIIMQLKKAFSADTECARSLDPVYVISYYIK